MSGTFERLRAALSDSYAVDRQVGEGGMATVFLAEDLKHRRQVAIKVLRPELAASLGADRFLREIELAARLQHPHIVPVYDSGAADGFLYYVMPFVEGESLRDLMVREGRVPLERAAAIVREAASALAYAHAHGVVHRDVKPENIMLSGGHAVVADFGIARAIDASRSEQAGLTGTGMAIGTPAYMSPEQATADAVDARSDQYSLACVFYEMVSGSQPFSAATMQALLTKVLTGPRPRLSVMASDTPAEVDAAVQRALQQEPEKRFPTITAFADALAQESSGAAAATRESRRWRRLAVVLPAVVAGVAAIWVLFFASPKTDIVSGAETIAVVPFTTSGAAVDGLGEGMVDLLAGSLDGVGEIRTIPSRQVLREWQRRSQDGPPDLEGAIDVARSVKAASVLTGSLVASGNNARLIAELYDLQGKQLARAQIDGPADSILTLADQLAVGLLRGIWQSREPLPSANSSGITSASMPAIRAYLDGERFHRRGQWDSAQVLFEQAVTSDSTFALAWYRLANTLGWIGAYNNPRAFAASRNAVKYSSTLPPRVRRILVAYEMFQRGDVAAADSMRAYTSSHPEDADGWYLLGESQYHARHTMPRSLTELTDPFDRVISIDSSLTPAVIHPVEMAIAAADTTAVRRYMGVLQRADAAEEIRRAAAALRVIQGNDSAARAMVANYGQSGIVMAALGGRILSPTANGENIEALFDSVYLGLPPAARVPFAHATYGAILGGLGRQSDARAIADSLRPIAPDLANSATTTAMYAGFASPDQLAEFGRRLANAPANNAFVAFFRALHAIDAGQPQEAGAHIVRALALPDSVRPSFLNGPLKVLDGIRLIALGDTVGGLARADSGLRTPSGLAPTPFAAAVTLRVALVLASRPQTRDEGIRRLRFGFADKLEFIPIVQYYLGRAYEAAGQRNEAAAAYGQFVRLWSRADTIYAPRIAEATDALQRLTAEDAR